MSDLPKLLDQVRLRTPARLLTGRSGGGYRTETQLELRTAHAAARDAVRAELDLQSHIGPELVARFGLFEVASQAGSKDEYLLRPDLGRRFDEQSQAEVCARCSAGADMQIVIGDGLSVTAMAAQVPSLLPALAEKAEAHGWKLGQPFVVRHCRVGIMNEVGELLRPRALVLLIGERPGLATAESLSAYMAYEPRANHTDADRNLISNIHVRGLTVAEAADRIVNLAEKMMRAQKSGVGLERTIEKKRLPS
jgi:ethanolamine ammonia-lyase small subunit